MKARFLRPTGVRDGGVPRGPGVRPTGFAARRNYTEGMGFGRLLITLGIVLVVLGVLVNFAGRLPFRLGRLPGDIYIQGKHSSFYFPLATCILLSVLFSLVLWIFRK